MLRDRKTCVCVARTVDSVRKSCYLFMDSAAHGIPQGSILGHALFHKYTNSLKSKLCQFAGDTSCVMASTVIATLPSSINTVVASMIVWYTMPTMAWY